MKKKRIIDNISFFMPKDYRFENFTPRGKIRSQILDEIELLDNKAERYIQAYVKKRRKLWKKFRSVMEDYDVRGNKI